MPCFHCISGLPNSYTYAPNVVSAFLAATATKVSVYILLRFVFSVFGVEFSFESLPTAIPFLVLAVLAMFLPSIVACFQKNVKRVLAYSSVAQIGYMILGLGLVSVAGLTASILHLFNHALMKGALFLVLGAGVLPDRGRAISIVWRGSPSACRGQWLPSLAAGLALLACP